MTFSPASWPHPTTRNWNRHHHQQRHRMSGCPRTSGPSPLVADQQSKSPTATVFHWTPQCHCLRNRVATTPSNGPACCSRAVVIPRALSLPCEQELLLMSAR
ncbi:Os03g0360401 [Oryza sativa Japonica Group]|uniref:Os03g0360401 protein n=1 Tax=Oryza sativa subsp. japonica TaxID=39947 RepID=A0A0P0VXP9_ORYSJ|nr:Os03g0360401 [Oryza sativa Japonica Group]